MLTTLRACNALETCLTPLAALGTPVTPTASGMQASPTWLLLLHTPMLALAHALEITS